MKNNRICFEKSLITFVLVVFMVLILSVLTFQLTEKPISTSASAAVIKKSVSKIIKPKKSVSTNTKTVPKKSLPVKVRPIIGGEFCR